MTKDYLFEIGTEEMPAHVVSRSVKQLADRTKKYLKENGLSFKDIKTYSTPRRLTILVEDLAEKQDDIDEVKKRVLLRRSLKIKTAIGQKLLKVLLVVKG